MVNQRRLDGVLLKVDGNDLPVDLYGRLSFVHVEESVQLPDTFTLHFDDPHFSLFDANRFTLGTRVEIAFRAEGPPILVTAGEVTSVAVESGVSGRHELVVGGLDSTHRLARGPKSRAFTNMTDADIASRIAGEYGLTAEIEGASEVRAHAMQLNETDYAFLRRIAGATGHDFYITEKVFHFKKKPTGGAGSPTLTSGSNLLDFSVRFASADLCDEVVVTAWDPLDKRVITGRAGTPDLGTDAPAAQEMAAAARRNFGRVTRRATQFPVHSQAEADTLAEALLAKAASEAVTVRGTAKGNPLLGAGAEVRLEGVGRRLAGRYRITSVEHSYGADRTYTTKFVCGGKDSHGLADLLGGSGRQNRGWGGLVRALVTNIGDKNKLGQVKVRYVTQGDHESPYASVVIPGAGAGRGAQWLPDVGDQVLVGFENDDPEHPIVLGGMWSRKDKPPATPSSKDGQQQVHVLAAGENHRLVFADGQTSSISLMLGKDCELHFADSKATLRAGKELLLTADEIKIEAGRSMAISAKESLDITTRGALSVKGQPVKLN